MEKLDIKKLLENWDGVLSEGKPITNEKVKKATAIILNNQHEYLTEAGTSWGNDSLGAGTYATSGVFHKIAVPMVRRTFPELVAHDLVGVQPLTGPVGIAFAMRFRAGVTAGDYTANTTELGYNTIDKTYSGSYAVSAGEALGSKAGSGVGSEVGLGVGSGTHIRDINMTVEKAQVEAVTRKLRSRWSLEVAQDLKAMHGLSMEEEMMDVLAYEITAEIDRELIDTIDSLCTSGNSNLSTWSFSASAQGVKGRWEMERYRELFHFMIRKCNLIATNTRRGSGNWVVGNPVATAIFETLSDFTIAPVSGDVSTATVGVARVGNLGGRMSVFRDTFQSSDQFIVGYKGPSEYDTGVIYLPYIQLLSQRATFEDSFNPAIGLMSRYAIHQHIFGAQNYYQKVSLTDLPS